MRPPLVVFACRSTIAVAYLISSCASVVWNQKNDSGQQFNQSSLIVENGGTMLIHILDRVVHPETMHAKGA